MTEYHWIPTREHAIETWGETPGAELEHEIINQFTTEPTRVLRAIEHVTRRHADGKITSCWAVLRAELQARPAVDVAASDKGDKTKATKRAEQWIETAGIHFDRESEVEHELFGDARLSEPDIKPEDGSGRGILHTWADDLALRERMFALWRNQRPKGEAAQNAELERAERWKAGRRELAAKLKTKPDTDQPATEQAATPEPALATEGEPW